MCKPGFGHNTNFLKWARAGFYTFLAISCMWIDVRLMVNYSDCLPSVYAMLTLTCIIHQLSHQCPVLVTCLRLCGCCVRKYTSSANVSRTDHEYPNSCCFSFHSSKEKRLIGMLIHITLAIGPWECITQPQQDRRDLLGQCF